MARRPSSSTNLRRPDARRSLRVAPVTVGDMRVAMVMHPPHEMNGHYATTHIIGLGAPPASGRDITASPSNRSVAIHIPRVDVQRMDQPRRTRRLTRSAT